MLFTQLLVEDYVRGPEFFPSHGRHECVWRAKKAGRCTEMHLNQGPDDPGLPEIASLHSPRAELCTFSKMLHANRRHSIWLIVPEPADIKSSPAGAVGSVGAQKDSTGNAPSFLFRWERPVLGAALIRTAAALFNRPRLVLGDL